MLDAIIPNKLQQTVPPAPPAAPLARMEVKNDQISSSSSPVTSRFQIKRSAVFWMTVSTSPSLLSFVMGILLAPVQQLQRPVAFLEAWREKRKEMLPRELSFYDPFIQSMRNDHLATFQSALVLPSRIEGRLATAIIDDQGVLQQPMPNTMSTMQSRTSTTGGKKRCDDEAAYYEALVHPILLAHEHPKYVALLGDHSSSSSVPRVLEEVLKHQTVEHILVVFVDATFSFPLVDEHSRVHIEARHVPISNLDRYLQDQDVNFDAIIFASDPVSGSITKLLEQEEFVSALKMNFLTDNGVMALSKVNLFHSPSQRHELEKWIFNFNRSGFENVIEYAYGKDEFLAVLADIDNRANWFATEAEFNLLIRERIIAAPGGDLPFLHFDSATMMALKFPTRLQEETFCHFPSRNCEIHGFDPNIPNQPVSSVQIHPSGIGDKSGRGTFAAVDIENGSFIALEECVHGMYVAPPTARLMYSILEMGDFAFWRTVAAGYVSGYGWNDNSMGQYSCGVDPGILTFANHGCNGTYNFGYHGPFNEQTAKLGVGPGANGYRNYRAIYDPQNDRYFPGWRCTHLRALRKIQAGEEMLDNYILYGGVEEGDDWEANLVELKGMCSGQVIGSVTEYELGAFLRK